MPQRIDEEVLAVLGSAIPEGNELRLTGQLERKLYERTNAQGSAGVPARLHP